MEYPAHTDTAMWEMYSSGELKILKWICNKVVYYNSSLVGMFPNRHFDDNSQEKSVIIKWKWDKMRREKGRCLCLQFVEDNENN